MLHAFWNVLSIDTSSIWWVPFIYRSELTKEVWFWTWRSVKENANAAKNLSCIKLSKPHQVSAGLYRGWFRRKVKRSLSTKKLHLPWYNHWVVGNQQFRTFWSWDCSLDISSYWCLRNLSYINVLILLLALLLSFISPWKLWLYCILFYDKTFSLICFKLDPQQSCYKVNFTWLQYLYCLRFYISFYTFLLSDNLFPKWRVLLISIFLIWFILYLSNCPTCAAFFLTRMIRITSTRCRFTRHIVIMTISVLYYFPNTS